VYVRVCCPWRYTVGRILEDVREEEDEDYRERMLFVTALRKKILSFTYGGVEGTCCEVCSYYLKLQN
jgi:hypothetical protein